MKNFRLPQLYPITNRLLSDSPHSAQAAQFAAGGAKIIQLRDKHGAPNEFYEQAVAAIEIARRQNVKIIVNDRVDIALAARADGVHLGQNDLPVAATRKILGDAAIIGFSTHTIAQAAAAAELPLDYIAIGPIFATATKENPEPVVGLDGLRAVRAVVKNIPLVAIGGITNKNARSVIEAGADSIAVISALFEKNKSISENVENLIQLLTAT